MCSLKNIFFSVARAFYLSLFLLLSCHPLFAQSKTDILHQLDSVYQNTDKEGKAAATISLAQFYASYNLDSARWVLERGLQFVRENQLPQYEPRLLNGMGITFYIEGDYAQAAHYYEQSLKINEAIQDSVGLGVNYSNLSNVYQALGKPVEALNYFYQAIELSTNQKDSLTLADIYNNLSNLYFHLNETDKALLYLRKSVQLYEQLGAEDLAATYNNLAVGFGKTNQFDSAHYYYRKAYHHALEINDKSSIILTLGNIANISYKEGKIDSALTLSKKVLELSADYFTLPQVIQAHNTLARVYLEYGELDSSEVHALKVLSLATDRAFLSGKVLALNQLHKVYHQKGRNELAYQYLLEYLAKNDTLQGDETRTQLARAETQYEYQNKLDLQARDYELQLTQKSLVNRLYLIGLISLALIVLLMIRLALVRRKLNKKLADRNAQIERDHHQIAIQKDELQELSEFKSKVLAVMAHDLKSPLASLQSMLSLFSDTDEEDIGVFRQMLLQLNQQIVVLMQNVDNLLNWAHIQVQGDQVFTNETAQIDEIIPPVIGLHQSLAKDKLLKVEVSIDPLLENESIQTSSESARIILRNLLSNAIKYSPEGETIAIRVSKIQNEVRFEVEDHGSGLSEELKSRVFQNKLPSIKGTRKEKGTGLGLLLAFEFVKRSNGSIGVESIEGQGSIFWFQLPLAKRTLNKV